MFVVTASLALTSAATPEAAPSDPGGAALALFILIVAVAGWIGLRQLVRGLRAQKTQSTVGTSFPAYALEALVNAASIDGRASETEHGAIVAAMRDLGAATDAAAVRAAFAGARLTKDELVAYLATRSRAFTRDQKTKLLKALLSVFAADGRFDEMEHAALVDYTAAVGFDRQSAPDMLRSLARDFRRGSIT